MCPEGHMNKQVSETGIRSVGKYPMMDGDPCIYQNSHKVYQTVFGNMQEYRNMMSGCWFFTHFPQISTTKVK